MGPNQDGGRGWAGQTRNGPNGAKWEGENSGKRPPKAGNLGEIPAVTPPVTARKVAAALVQSFPSIMKPMFPVIHLPKSQVDWRRLFLPNNPEMPNTVAAASLFGYVHVSEDGNNTSSKPQKGSTEIRALAVPPTNPISRKPRPCMGILQPRRRAPYQNHGGAGFKPAPLVVLRSCQID